jgi:hypothetical protein
MRTRLIGTSLLTPILLALLFIAAGNAFGQINPSASYHITAQHSGKCLAVSGGNSFVNNGVGVIQWDCIETEDNQKWQILPVGFGYYKIVAQHSGKSLEVRGGVGALINGDAVQQWDYVGAANQKWWLNPVGDDFYQIVASHSRKSLEVSGGLDATTNGPYTQQWDYVGAANQKWKLTELPDRVTGTFTYADAETDPGGSATFNRPIVGCRVQVWRAGAIASTTETDSAGSFNVTVTPMPDGTDTTVVIYATNAAAQVLAGTGPYFVRRTILSQGNTTLDFSENLATAEQIRSFNAAQDIRLAHDFAVARRDPQEREVIPVADVSFNDLGGLMTHYNAPGSGLVINREHEVRDLVIMHEYAHFLEDKIGSFLLMPSFHDTCFTTQRCPNPADCANFPITSTTLLVNSPENAWMEGFANYFAMAVKRANPSQRFNLTGAGMTEAELNNPGSCDAVGRAAFDGHTINGEMVEKFVASVLWAASSSPGSDAEVFQIFDKELDGSATGRLPNIRLFRDAWSMRGNDPARLDDILRVRHIEL